MLTLFATLWLAPRANAQSTYDAWHIYPSAVTLTGFDAQGNPATVVLRRAYGQDHLIGTYLVYKPTITAPINLDAGNGVIISAALDGSWADIAVIWQTNLTDPGEQPTGTTWDTLLGVSGPYGYTFTWADSHTPTSGTHYGQLWVSAAEYDWFRLDDFWRFTPWGFFMMAIADFTTVLPISVNIAYARLFMDAAKGGP